MQTLFLFHRGKQILDKSILSIKKLNLGVRTVHSGAAFCELASVRPSESHSVPQKSKLNCGRSAICRGLAENGGEMRGYVHELRLMESDSGIGQRQGVLVRVISDSTTWVT